MSIMTSKLKYNLKIQQMNRHENQVSMPLLGRVWIVQG